MRRMSHSLKRSMVSYQRFCKQRPTQINAHSSVLCRTTYSNVHMSSSDTVCNRVDNQSLDRMSSQDTRCTGGVRRTRCIAWWTHGARQTRTQQQFATKVSLPLTGDHCVRRTPRCCPPRGGESPVYCGMLLIATHASLDGLVEKKEKGRRCGRDVAVLRPRVMILDLFSMTCPDENNFRNRCFRDSEERLASLCTKMMEAPARSRYDCHYPTGVRERGRCTICHLQLVHYLHRTSVYLHVPYCTALVFRRCIAYPVQQQPCGWCTATCSRCVPSAVLHSDTGCIVLLRTVLSARLQQLQRASREAFMAIPISE